MRVKFTADHDDVTPEKTVAYKAGSEETVRKELGEELILAKKAEAVGETPAKPPATKTDGG